MFLVFTEKSSSTSITYRSVHIENFYELLVSRITFICNSDGGGGQFGLQKRRPQVKLYLFSAV